MATLEMIAEMWAVKERQWEEERAERDRQWAERWAEKERQWAEELAALHARLDNVRSEFIKIANELKGMADLRTEQRRQDLENPKDRVEAKVQRIAACFRRMANALTVTGLPSYRTAIKRDILPPYSN
ncbi:hypothetical protein BC832DRAFT_593738 [Gaertneriomyces semiglobifer]|nr:hypothetical protein BC832DRAFT_593738 [Gaertneriomyces semiglobifer]